MDHEDETLQHKRQQAIDDDRCFSKTTLKNEYRMKPAPDAVPVAYYGNGYGGQFPVYKIKDCVELKLRRPTTRTPKQVRAQQVLALKAKLRSNLAKASIEASQLIGPDTLFGDTETTGTEYNDQVIELAILNSVGECLLETEIKPTVPIHPEALRTHGKSDASLADAPSWPEISDQVKSVLAGRRIVFFNAAFDIRLLKQTALAFERDVKWLDDLNVYCAMGLAADAFGSTNKYGSISLADAMASAGVEWTGSAHSAKADSMAMLNVVKVIADYRQSIQTQIDELEALVL